MSEVDRQLSHAYELIEAGNYREAREILEPLLVTERDNADVWWMYSHAVEDREKARDALENVLRIDPNYEGAEELLSETRGGPPVTLENRDDVDDDALIDAFLEDDDFEDDLDALDDDFDTTSDRNETSSGGRRTAILGFLLLAIIIIVVVLGFLLLNTGDDDDDRQTVADTTAEVTQPSIVDDTPIPTIGAEESVVQPSITEDSTEEATIEVEDTTPTDEPDPTDENPTETAVAQAQTADSSYDFLYEAFGDLSVVEDSDEVVETDLGDTLLIAVCSTPGNQLRADLERAMNTIAEESDTLTAVDAAGIRLQDCDADRTINVIAVSVEDARARNAGDFTDDTFSSRWRPVG